MSGVRVIWSLLTHNAAMVAAVPAIRIREGDLPLGIAMPAIAVTLVNGTPSNTVAMTEPTKMHSDRVQVSVFIKGPAGTPPGAGASGLADLLELVLDACPRTHGTVAGVNVLSVIPEGEGPDLSDQPTSLYSRSRDFTVQWTR